MSKNKGNTGGAPKASASIEDNLRKVYQEILNEDIPDRLKDLLAQLRASQGVEGAAKAASTRARPQHADDGASDDGASDDGASDGASVSESGANLGGENDGNKGEIGST